MLSRFALALTLIMCAAGSAYTRLMCKDTLNSEVSSPDGVLVATWLTRDCGATTDFSTSVNVHRPDHGFADDAGTVFVAMGRHHLDLRWVDSKHLNIKCDGCSRKQVFRTTTMLGDIDVTFLLPGAGPSAKQ